VRELGGRAVELADEQRVAGGLAERTHRLERERPVARVPHLERRGFRVARERERPGRRRVVTQLLVFAETVDRVQAEPVDAAVEPEAHHVLHRLHDVRIPPIEVRLLRVERVQVPTPGPFVAAPGRAAEGRDPVVRRPVDGDQTYRSGCSRNHGWSVEVCDGTEVEEHLQPERVRLADERVEVVERPQPRVDARVVGDVVAEVRERRG
jgi:hypothetical protein